MPENYLDRIPGMAARTWTGAPAEVFYNMYEDGEDFTASMTQHIQSQFGEYDEALEFDDMELYNVDEFAVEKAAYQQQFDFPVSQTPWGDSLSPLELDQVSIDYPGVLAGFDASSEDGILQTAENITSMQDFKQISAEIDAEITNLGLLGNEVNIYESLGDNLDFTQNNTNEALGINNPGFAMMANPMAFSSGSMLQGFDWTGIKDNVGEFISDIGEAYAYGATLQSQYSTMEQVAEAEQGLEFNDRSREFDRMYRDTPGEFLNMLADPENYAQIGENPAMFNIALIEEWIDDFENKTPGTYKANQFRQAVNSAERALVSADFRKAEADIDTGNYITDVNNEYFRPGSSNPSAIAEIKNARITEEEMTAMELRQREIEEFGIGGKPGPMGPGGLRGKGFFTNEIDEDYKSIPFSGTFSGVSPDKYQEDLHFGEGDDEELFNYLQSELEKEELAEDIETKSFGDDGVLPGAGMTGPPMMGTTGETKPYGQPGYMPMTPEERARQNYLDAIGRDQFPGHLEATTAAQVAADAAKEAIGVSGISEEEVDPGLPGYEDRFINEFNRRPGSGRFEYRSRIDELYNEADLLYYLTEPWENKPKFEYDPTEYPENWNYKDAMNLFPDDRIKEEDHYSKWVNQFFDKPETARGNLGSAARSLRDNMNQFEGLPYDQILSQSSADTSYQRMMFMNPETYKSGNRIATLVASYNAPPGADPWFKKQQQQYYQRMLQNWERAGNSREAFLSTFIQDKVASDPTSESDDQEYANI